MHLHRWIYAGTSGIACRNSGTKGEQVHVKRHRAMGKDCHAQLVSRRRFNVEECMAFLILASLGFAILCRIGSEGSRMVTAMRASCIKTLLFAVIDAIQSEEVPTLHHQSLMPLSLLVSNRFLISQLPLFL